MGFPRQEYWNGLQFPFPGDLPNPGMELTCPAWQADSSSLSHLDSPIYGVLLLSRHSVMSHSLRPHGLSVTFLCIKVHFSSVAQSCLILCDPMDCSQSDSSVHGILQVRIMEWVVISFSRGSSQPRDQTRVSCIANRLFTAEPPKTPQVFAAAKLLQSHPTLCNPINSSPPGSPVPRILQARTPEWVAMSFSNA